MAFDPIHHCHSLPDRVRSPANAVTIIVTPDGGIDLTEDNGRLFSFNPDVFRFTIFWKELITRIEAGMAGRYRDNLGGYKQVPALMGV